LVIEAGLVYLMLIVSFVSYCHSFEPIMFKVEVDPTRYYYYYHPFLLPNHRRRVDPTLRSSISIFPCLELNIFL